MRVLTVKQVNKIIKDLLDNEVILEDIMVTGELSSFSITRNIAYFTLKDTDNLLSCVMFNPTGEFQIGDMVQCRGNIKYYTQGGRLTFNALSIELCGQGELYKQFLLMKDKLEKEGLFSEDHKIPIPKFINSIGVVTSKTGAVLQDIKNVATRRNPNVDIYVYDAQVQGKFAVNDVIQGITYFDNMTDVDVIIVARGGGSIEDLMPFNDEELARVAYVCNKPLISAVGHETDFSILDFVSDLRAPTPSAAAELVTFDTLEIKRYISDITSNMHINIHNKYQELLMNVDYNISSIERIISSNIDGEILHISELVSQVERSIDQKMDNTMHSIDILTNTLDKLNPMRILRSGYAYATKDSVSLSKANADVGDEINIMTDNNKYSATITRKETIC
ncbi:MAG: exodeoxyribonuclease VII large subunit [Clostridia bacterium]|nr:exodeoxyribonuclease VII large subunit [Clostridia bacterium]